MWYCKDCDIEITKYKRNRHKLSSKHLINIGENPYLNGKIYKILCLDENDDRVYIGSTIIPLEERLKKHKQHVNEKREKRMSSCEIIDNCRIELIENYPCNNVNELKKREQYHIEKNKCINKNRAYVGSKRERAKNYREKHKEKLKKKRAEKILCECGRTYSHNHKQRHFRTKIHKELLKDKTGS